MKTKFRTKYEPRKVSCFFDSKRKLTDPQYLKDCSIEGILNRYGALPRPETPAFGCDCTQFGDMADCMNRVQFGLDSFMALPSHIRERFGNDPRAFYTWIANPSNTAEAVKLGLMTERRVEKTELDVLKDIADSVRGTSEEGKQS